MWCLHVCIHIDARGQHQVFPSITPHLIFFFIFGICVFVFLCRHVCAHVCATEYVYIKKRLKDNL